MIYCRPKSLNLGPESADDRRAQYSRHFTYHTPADNPQQSRGFEGGTVCPPTPGSWCTPGSSPHPARASKRSTLSPRTCGPEIAQLAMRFRCSVPAKSRVGLRPSIERELEHVRGVSKVAGHDGCDASVCSQVQNVSEPLSINCSVKGNDPGSCPTLHPTLQRGGAR